MKEPIKLIEILQELKSTTDANLSETKVLELLARPEYTTPESLAEVNKKGQTPLLWLIKHNYPTAAMTLLDKSDSAVFQKIDNKGFNCLLQALEARPKHVALISAILHHPACTKEMLLFKLKNDGSTPLFIAIRDINLDLVKLISSHPLCDKDVLMASRLGYDGNTLTLAATKENSDLLNCLLVNPSCDAEVLKGAQIYDSTIIDLILGSFHSIMSSLEDMKEIIKNIDNVIQHPAFDKSSLTERQQQKIDQLRLKYAKRIQKEKEPKIIPQDPVYTEEQFLEEQRLELEELQKRVPSRNPELIIQPRIQEIMFALKDLSAEELNPEEIQQYISNFLNSESGNALYGEDFNGAADIYNRICNILTLGDLVKKPIWLLMAMHVLPFLEIAQEKSPSDPAKLEQDLLHLFTHVLIEDCTDLVRLKHTGFVIHVGRFSIGECILNYYSALIRLLNDHKGDISAMLQDKNYLRLTTQDQSFFASKEETRKAVFYAKQGAVLVEANRNNFGLAHPVFADYFKSLSDKEQKERREEMIKIVNAYYGSHSNPVSPHY